MNKPFFLSMLNIFIDFIKFSSNPIKIRIQDYTIKKKILESYYWVLIYLFMAILIAMILAILAKIILFFYSINLVKIRDNNIQNSINQTYPILILTLFGPLVEEVLFRLWLSFKKIDLIISLVFIYMVVVIKSHHVSIYGVKIDLQFFYSAFYALSFSGLITFIILKTTEIKKFINAHFRFIFWFSCFGFGLIHLVNYNPLNFNIIWVYPFFILPQLLLGFILGYIRMKNGFFWGLLVHSLINIPAALFYIKY